MKQQPTEDLPGFFISIDGIDGSGKTTLAQHLALALQATGEDVLLTREPGGTRLGETLRKLLLDPHVQLTDRAEFLLFNAARSQHVTEVIYPALEAGKTVITDRFAATTRAYQGAARGLRDSFHLEPLITWAAHGLQPHVTFIMDLPVEQAMGRRAQRDVGLSPDRFDRTQAAFMEAARSAYREQVRDDIRTYLLNARYEADQVLREALSVLKGVRAMALQLA